MTGNKECARLWCVFMLSAGVVMLSSLVTWAIPEDLSTLTWTRLGGPLGGIGYDIRMDPTNPDTLFVTDANAGLHRSDNGGKSWELVTVKPGGRFLAFCVAIDPNNADFVWTGSKGDGEIYFSADGGLTWEKRSNGIMQTSGLALRGITVEPGNSQVVYAAGELASWVWSGRVLTGHRTNFDLTQGVVYKSTDQGRSWCEIWRGDNLARYVLIDPRDTNVIYVSTGIFDREAANSDTEAFEPGGVGILKSVDGGESWAVLNESDGLTGLFVGSLEMHPENPDILLAGAGHDLWSRGWTGPKSLGGAFLSQDGGETWTYVLDCEIVSAVAFAPSDPRIVYAAGDYEIHRSDDGGLTWRLLERHWGPPGILPGFPIDFEVDPRDPYRIFVNNYVGGCFVSEDGGETWQDSSTGYSGASVEAGFAIDPADPCRVYCAAVSGLFLSEDGGVHWQGLAFDPARVANPRSVAVDPRDGHHVIQNPADMAMLAISNDGGCTWLRSNPIGSGQGPEYLDIAFAPSNPEVVYAGAGSRGCEKRGFVQPGECDIDRGGVYLSRNGGLTWQDVSGVLSGKSVAAVAVNPRDPLNVLAGVLGHGLYETTDGGGSWTKRNVDLSSVRDIAFAPTDPSIVYAGGDGQRGGAFRSEDGGISWEWAAGGMDPEGCVFAIAVDPNDAMVVWAAGGGGKGVRLTTNGGRHWIQITAGVADELIISLSLSVDGSVLYGGTGASGAFRLMTSGGVHDLECDPDREGLSGDCWRSQAQAEPDRESAGTDEGVGQEGMASPENSEVPGQEDAQATSDARVAAESAGLTATIESLDELLSFDVLLADDYETGDGREIWGRDSDSSWEVVAGDTGLVLRLGRDGVNSNVGIPSDDYVLSCRFSSERYVRLLLRATYGTQQAYYELFIDVVSGQVQLSRRMGNDQKSLAEGRTALGSLTWHELVVILDGGSLAVLIDHARVLTAADSDPIPAGDNWLRITSDGSAMIDDVEIRAIPD